jgi:hypothetical protein
MSIFHPLQACARVCDTTAWVPQQTIIKRQPVNLAIDHQNRAASEWTLLGDSTGVFGIYA